LRIFTANFGECGDAAGRGGRFCAFARQKFFRREFNAIPKVFKRAPTRALDAGWFFAAFPRVRARLAELRAARFATLHIVNHQQTRERRARPPGRVTHSPPGGRARIRAVFISASEDEP
jgi:hypothetical protein